MKQNQSKIAALIIAAVVAILIGASLISCNTSENTVPTTDTITTTTQTTNTVSVTDTTK